MTTRKEQLTYKNYESGVTLFLIQCAHCHRENSLLYVASGICAWCGWEEGINENPKIEEKEEKQ